MQLTETDLSMDIFLDDQNSLLQDHLNPQKQIVN